MGFGLNPGIPGAGDTELATESKQDLTNTKLDTLIAAQPGSYNLKYDEGATYTYIGEASPGTATSAALWRIKRLTNADNTIVWIDGNSSFDNVWDDRASGVYS